MPIGNLLIKPCKQEMSGTYIFEAPREVVFKVFVDPKLIPDWWGPSYLTSKVVKMEVRPGGFWRIVQHDPKGKRFAFHGVYHEVVEPAKVVYTFEYEGLPGHILLETVKFEDWDGITKMTDQMVFQSAEDRDNMLRNGMQEGTSESMARLADLVLKTTLKT
jgi:uncharacterized protein YndB with AHSA1/START domain